MDKVPPQSKCPEHSDDDEDEEVTLFTEQNMLMFANAMLYQFTGIGPSPPVITADHLEQWIGNHAVGIDLNKSDLERTIQLLITLENAK